MVVKKLLKKRPSGKKSPIKSKKYNKITSKPKQKKNTLVTQDLQFARSLASNDKKIREKTLKKLRVWISARSKSPHAFTEMDFMRLWKGLFYCMWLSDKSLVQEDLAESISHLVHCFESMEMSKLYTKCALNTLSTEWFGIDQFRLDKFQMLVRRILRQTLIVCKKQSWDMNWVKNMAKIIEEILLNEKCPLGFSFHITDIYCEELAKISEGDIPEDIVTELLRPFAINLATQSDNRQIRHTSKQIFRYLIFQSDVGMDYREKFEAWSRAGFPTGNIDAMEKVESSDEENEEIEEEEQDEMMDVDISDNKKVNSKALDPRAGRVDVEIPQVPFDPNQIINLLGEYKLCPASTPKTRKHMSKLINEFKEIAQGNMPIGIKTVDLPKRKKADFNPTKAAKRLINFEDDLYERRKNKKTKKTSKTSSVENAPVKIKKSKKSANISVKIPEEELVAVENVSSDLETITSVKKSESPNKALSDLETTTITPAKKLKKKNKVLSDSETTATPAKKLKKSNKTLSDLETTTPVKKLKSPNKALSDSETTTTPDKKLKSPNKTLSDLETTTTPAKKLKTPKKSLSDLETSTPVKEKKLKTPTDINKKSPIKEKKSKTPVKTPIKPSTISPAKTPSPLLQTSPQKQKKSTPSVQTIVTTPLATGTKSPGKKDTFKTPVKTPLFLESTSSSKKRVRIVLQKNTAQLTSEYFRQLRMSPQIPFDGNRKPPAGVLKPSPLSSPINPFYKL